MERTAEEEIARLQKQVTELQNKGSELEKEKRLYKRLYLAARTILEKVLIDSSLLDRLRCDGLELEPGEVGKDLSGMSSLFARIEQLEFDSNTAAASTMREYIVQARKLQPFSIDTYGEFVHLWRQRFIQVVGDPEKK